MTVCWTYDERVEDGIYSAVTLAGIKDRLEKPELLLLRTGELANRRG
jgi:pyruvate/2-oxoglutarate dehydrogenase complex dihydrolipoamide acyltransferase (E2) component